MRGAIHSPRVVAHLASIMGRPKLHKYAEKLTNVSTVPTKHNGPRSWTCSHLCDDQGSGVGLALLQDKPPLHSMNGAGAQASKEGLIQSTPIPSCG